jgi:putative ABC transport system permease protein
VDIDYINTLNIVLIEGRDFSKDKLSDQRNTMIVNEALINKFQIESPIDKPISENFINNDSSAVSGRIIGVMKNIHYVSLREKIKPAIVRLTTTGHYQKAYIKMRGQNKKETIQIIESEFKRTAPDIPFSYYFLDEKVAQQYVIESRWSKMVNYASSFAMFIAASGLFGLTLLVVVRRTKEIGIRKVLGASITNIMKLINRDFIGLVIIANIFAWPTAYLVLDKLFQNYAYHVPLSFWVFAVSGLCAIIIAVITISINSLKAANANPVNTLKYE